MQSVVIKVALVGALVAAIGGCDSMSGPPASATCTEIGAQCQLPDGPLGVCQEAPCRGNTAPPCFVCTSQH